MQVVDLYTTYAFIKRLVTPFKKWKAYKLGIINEKGEQLKHRKDLHTLEEKDAFGFLDILALNLKKLLAKVPGGQTTLGTYAAALLLLKEYPKVQAEDVSLLDELPGLLETYLEEAGEFLVEDGAPTNSIGSGNIASSGNTPLGKAPVSQRSKYKKKNEEDTRKMLSGVRSILIKRKKP